MSSQKAPKIPKKKVCFYEKLASRCEFYHFFKRETGSKEESPRCRTVGASLWTFHFPLSIPLNNKLAPIQRSQKKRNHPQMENHPLLAVKIVGFFC